MRDAVTPAAILVTLATLTASGLGFLFVFAEWNALALGAAAAPIVIGVVSYGFNAKSTLYSSRRQDRILQKSENVKAGNRKD